MGLTVINQYIKLMRSLWWLFHGILRGWHISMKKRMAFELFCGWSSVNGGDSFDGNPSLIDPSAKWSEAQFPKFPNCRHFQSSLISTNWLSRSLFVGRLPNWLFSVEVNLDSILINEYGFLTLGLSHFPITDAIVSYFTNLIYVFGQRVVIFFSSELVWNPKNIADATSSLSGMRRRAQVDVAMDAVS